MATIRSSLDPTPAQGLAYDIGGLSPQRWTGTKAGTQTVATGVARFTNDTGKTLELTKVTASVGTAPTGAALIVDVHKEGTTVFSAQSQRPTIAAGQKTATAVPAVSTQRVVLEPGQVLTVDVDQIGSTVAGSDLTVTVEAKPTRSGNDDKDGDITLTDAQVNLLA